MSRVREGAAGEGSHEGPVPLLPGPGSAEEGREVRARRPLRLSDLARGHLLALGLAGAWLVRFPDGPRPWPAGECRGG